jgi:hypothetical protein
MKLAILSVAIAASMAAAQPVQWRVQDGGNGHWYEGVVFASPQTLTTAQAYATSIGAHVVSITSPAEELFLSPLSSEGRLWMNFYVGPIIGIRCDAGVCSQGCWLSNEPVTFTNWWPGNPDDVGIAGCVFLYAHTSQWQNYPCDAQDLWGTRPRSAIIEWDADCNNDGIVDKGQILSGELPDANNNGIPDWSLNITRQPINQSVGVDLPVFFVVEATTTSDCTTPINYRWQRRNPQVLDATAPNAWVDLSDGGGFLNTGTASLTILRPTAGLATGYRCKLSGGCGCEGVGTGVRYTDVVNFAPACPSDFNNDGSVDGDDVITFFDRWDRGC